jgi:hypothetical protein
VQNPQNVNLVVEIAVEYTDAMGGWEKVLGVMEKAPNAAQVEFAYLARRINSSEQPEEHYRYIVAAAKCQQFQARAPSCLQRRPALRTVQGSLLRTYTRQRHAPPVTAAALALRLSAASAALEL